jgi:hypothetical protein
VRLQLREARILDFDIERRPLSYAGGDWTTGEVTAIAASWVGEDLVHCWQLDTSTSHVASMTWMLLGFRGLYEEADIVTGHYIRPFDLPHINGALAEFGLPGLTPKLTSDTKQDCLVTGDISKSQENLAAMLGIDAPKIHVNQHEWRQANRLTPEGLKATEERVVGDVIQHKALRAEMLRRGLLGPPKQWSPERKVRR